MWRSVSFGGAGLSTMASLLDLVISGGPDEDLKPLRPEFVTANDPAGAQVFLYTGTDMGLCCGVIGNKGRVCVKLASECSTISHSRNKKALSPGTWYVYDNTEATYLNPSLEEAIASKSALWAQSKDGVLHVASWEQLMSFCKSNAEASSPSQQVSEALGRSFVLEASEPIGSLPKTPRVQLPRSVFSSGVVGDRELEATLQASLATTEEALAELYSLCTKLSARLGTPSKDTPHHGSVFNDLAAAHLYSSELDSRATITGAAVSEHASKLEDMGVEMQAIVQQVARVGSHSQAAYDTATRTATSVAGLGSTGVVGRLDSMGLALRKSEANTARLEMDVASLSELVQALLAERERGQRSGENRRGEAATMVTLQAEVASMKGDLRDQLKVLVSTQNGQGPVKVGNVMFDGVRSCAQYLASNNITFDVIELLCDQFTLLASLTNRSQTQGEVETQAILQMKTDVTPAAQTTLRRELDQQITAFQTLKRSLQHKNKQGGEGGEEAPNRKKKNRRQGKAAGAPGEQGDSE
ncbi:hypothetical protein HJC23_010686 [Cyclotella cryptica]|uniref:Uncharacterized protein n=1 Tax=Cyclotella cryptica TaxID=29204 RepID=A0ABD3PAA1_9STRA